MSIPYNSDFILCTELSFCWQWDAMGDGFDFGFILPKFRFTNSSGFMSNSQSISAGCLRGSSEDLGKGFWQQWQQYRDYLHRCCMKWMSGNPTDPEDALSRVMLKAWEKVQNYAGEITNFKAWLTKLTHNLCVDIHQERRRGANQVEDIEGYAKARSRDWYGVRIRPYVQWRLMRMR